MNSLDNKYPQLTIALDGYSSCGKSTFAKSIAARLGYIFIDTGAMYRAITLYALRNGALQGGEIDHQRVIELLPSIAISFCFNAERGASDIYVNGEKVEEQIRTIEVSNFVSAVSSIGEVRTELVALQRAMGRDGGVVMDGRDIGTVVLPEADIKLFMTADPAIRAERRYKELTAKGDDVSIEQIEANIRERDTADVNRKISPLRQAPDAIVLDNSSMSVDEQMEWFMALYAECCAKKSK